MGSSRPSCRKGALVVLNDTRVLRARLLGKKPETGGKVEIFLVRKVGERHNRHRPERAAARPRERERRDVEVWRALGKASKPLKFDTDIIVGAGGSSPGSPAAPGRPARRATARPRRGRRAARGRADRPRRRHASTTRSARLGHVPLPPYIKRDDGAEDAERYQTVFARVDGAVAAPTAGLHLTRALLGRLAVRGCDVATRHASRRASGTFQPVTVEDLDEHPMHAERFDVLAATADARSPAPASAGPRSSPSAPRSCGRSSRRRSRSRPASSVADRRATRGCSSSPGYALPGRRHAPHELPPPALDAPRARVRLRRHRARARRVPRRRRRGVPLLLVRRRDAPRPRDPAA